MHIASLSQPALHQSTHTEQLAPEPKFDYNQVY